MKTRILITGFTAFFLLLSFLPSCKKTTDNLPDQPVPINLTTRQLSLVSSGNAFAFDLFRQILNNTPDSKNVIISPLSISYALSMALNGAASSTRDSMLKALRIDNLAINDLNQSYKDLTAALLSVDRRVLISIANSVWTEKSFVVKKPFMDILANYYNSEDKSFDISDPNAPAAMNTWIELKTNGLIKNMIDKLESNSVMMLINAIYFKGKWNVQFDKSSTAPRLFTKSDGTEINPPAMHQTETHNIYFSDKYTLAELKYGQGNFVIDIILPANNDMNSIMPYITDSGFLDMTGKLAGRKVNLYMPKFKNSFKSPLKDILSAMGMRIAFTDGADFSNISDRSLLINSVTHQAFIETNEEGTEAAAATVVSIGFTSAGPNDPVLLDINHPFLYIIREVTTNSILFMGKVADPLVN